MLLARGIGAPTISCCARKAQSPRPLKAAKIWRSASRSLAGALVPSRSCTTLCTRVSSKSINWFRSRASAPASKRRREGPDGWRRRRSSMDLACPTSSIRSEAPHSRRDDGIIRPIAEDLAKSLAAQLGCSQVGFKLDDVLRQAVGLLLASYSFERRLDE